LITVIFIDMIVQKGIAIRFRNQDLFFSLNPCASVFRHSYENICDKKSIEWNISWYNMIE